MSKSKARCAPLYTAIDYARLKQRNGYKLSDDEKQLLGIKVKKEG